MNYLSTGAGFFPSTVCAQLRILWIQLGADLWEFHRPRGNLVQGALKFLWILHTSIQGMLVDFLGFFLNICQDGYVMYIDFVYVYIYICIFTSITKHKVWLYIFFCQFLYSISSSNFVLGQKNTASSWPGVILMEQTVSVSWHLKMVQPGSNGPPKWCFFFPGNPSQNGRNIQVAPSTFTMV